VVACRNGLWRSPKEGVGLLFVGIPLIGG